MADSPTTQPSLLVRIRDARDGEAWTQFVEVYAPLVYGFARKKGLQDADAADLTQEVLCAVAAAMRSAAYRAAGGTFRGWLFTVARNKLLNFLAKQKNHPQGTGDSNAKQKLEEQPAPGEEVQEWDQEYERRLFHWAAEQIRDAFEERTWQAFWQTAVQAHDPKTVADTLGLSVGSVYVAKSRVLARLKERVAQLQTE